LPAENWTATPSTPSMLVPDIKPKYTPSAGLPVSTASVLRATLLSCLVAGGVDYPRIDLNR
jgi:hypothetical protein